MVGVLRVQIMKTVSPCVFLLFFGNIVYLSMGIICFPYEHGAQVLMVCVGPVVIEPLWTVIRLA